MTVIVETLNIGFVIPMSECDLELTTSDKGLLNGAAFLGKVKPLKIILNFLIEFNFRYCFECPFLGIPGRY